MSDYRVVIGNGQCNISSLSDRLLTCRPPYDEPQLSVDNPCGVLFNSILVRNIFPHCVYTMQIIQYIVVGWQQAVNGSKGNALT